MALLDPVLIQTVQGNGGGYVQTFNKSITPTAGSLLCVEWVAGDADTLTISDNNGNTWRVVKEQTLSGQRRIKTIEAYNCKGGATTITFTNTNFGDSAVIIQEFRIMPQYFDPFDVAGSSTTTSGTTYAVTSPTTNAFRELLIGGLGCESNSPGFTGDAAWSNLITQAGFDSFTSCTTQYRIVTAPGAYSWTLTNGTGRQVSQDVCSFKAEAANLFPTF